MTRRIALFVSVPLLSVATMAATQPAHATTWYVNSADGSDTKNGQTAGTAFATLQKAADSTAACDTVYVFPGVGYGGGTSGISPLIIRKSGRSGCPITYAAYPGTRPVISGTRASAAIMGFYPLSYITINGFELAGWNASLSWTGASANAGASGTGWQNPTYTAVGVFFGGGTGGRIVHHVVIQNNRIHDFPQGGVAVNFADYVKVAGNVVYYTGFYGPWSGSGISLYELHNIDSGTGTKNYVTGNLTYANANYMPNHGIAATTTATSAAGAGAGRINVASASRANYGMAVIDVTRGTVLPNTFIGYFGNGYIGLAGGRGGISGSGVAKNDVLQFGYITDGEGVIIDNNSNSQSDGIPYLGRTSVSNNIAYNNGNSAIECGPQSNNCDITFNTTYFNQTTWPSGSGAAQGEINVNGTRGSNIFNNSMSGPSGLPLAWDQSAGTTIWGYNGVFGGNTTHSVPGSHNVFGNPMFTAASINPAVANFQLQSGSPEINAGDNNYTRASDFGGNSGLWGSSYDIGAYEYHN